jgi:hypothetical protein
MTDLTMLYVLIDYHKASDNLITTPAGISVGKWKELVHAEDRYAKHNAADLTVWKVYLLCFLIVSNMLTSY